MPHGNAEPERGFSINKYLLKVHGTATEDETIIALRLIKDHILSCKGMLNIVITKDLLSAQGAYQRYTDHLKVKRELEKAAEAEMEKQRLAAIEASLLKDVEEKKKAEKDQIEKDLKTLQDGISVADEVMAEVNLELGGVIEGKAIDAKRVKRCHAKMTMAIERKKELEREVEVVKKKLMRV